MVFNSFDFFIFFTVVTSVNFLLPQKYRWILLLASSCYFYMAFIPSYIFILFAAIALDYAMAILIEDSQGKVRKRYLIFSILGTCSLLFVFKYFNFVNENLSFLLKLINWNYSLSLLNIALPIGLSFHVFQSLSYVIEVYKERQKAERDFGIYSLYVMFFPQLVAGPIERPQNMLHQLRDFKDFDYDSFIYGIKLMGWGLFKKAVIADRAAVVVNYVYRSPGDFGGPQLAIATVLFALQIYCDFSGYSDMAIGIAKIYGVNLMQNFNSPYFAKSIDEFWKRWHISLSSWFRDYIYIPLGGNRVSKWKRIRNVMITFLLSGLWHGASWTYIVWGGIHGLYVSVQSLLASGTNNFKKRLNIGASAWNCFGLLVTFLATSYAWIFFRADSLSDALGISNKLLFGWQEFLYHFISQVMAGKVAGAFSYFYIGSTFTDFLILDFAVIALFLYEMINRNKDVILFLDSKPIWLRFALFYIIAMAILLFGVFDSSQFIYFQF